MHTPKKILIVDDDRDLATLLETHLKEAGFEIRCAHDGLQAIKLAVSLDYALIILDVKMPGLSGFDACEQIKKFKPNQRILFVTSLSDEIDRIVGFERGADDYVTKPFSPREVVARVKAILKRGEIAASSSSEQELIAIGNLEINLASRKIFKSSAELSLTALEFDLLVFLIKNKGRAFSREQLLQSVWGYDSGAYEHTVNSHINRLRAKIEDQPTTPTYIQTVWGVGYRFGG